MHKDLLIVQSCFSDILHLFSRKICWMVFLNKYFIIKTRATPQLFPSSSPAPMLTSEFHLNLKAYQPHLISLVLAIKSQHQTALPASKAIAQAEPEGNKTEPVEKLLKSNSFAGLSLTWKTWKSQGI